MTSSSFDLRAPSVAWEVLPLLNSSGVYIWAWFKPQHVPNGAILRLPDETRAVIPPHEMTFRRLLDTAGITPESVVGCTVYGVPMALPFDQPLPIPLPGADPHIAVSVQASAAPSAIMAPEMVASHVTATAASDQAVPDGVFDRIDTDWQACLLLESQLVSLRKQLIGLQGRLDSLNRDLSPEERLHADRLDQNDWLAARRWLRECSAKLARCVKEHDVGEVSNCGKRLSFEQTYQQFIAPRRSFAEPTQVERDFAGYRKTLQTLMNRMSSAQTSASQDGVQRAQQVLGRIAAKARKARGGR